MITGIAEAEIILKVVFAAIMGIIIGFEREIDLKPAGVRTHSLVCMGAALFTALSFVVEGPNVDHSRIAAGIVTGIGFLGAGAIFMAKDKIKGLTTAADLWVLAAVGVAIGMGLFLTGLVTTLIIYVTLSFGRYMKRMEKKHKKFFSGR
ncbi:MAG: MgtC/SapB family protein [Candidatus Aenigmatarchaeota archaeon]|nr:MgtC/SapB family protein [Nanoarchaeota archaeon]